MTQEIQTVIDRHERAVAILERIKWNLRDIESLTDWNRRMVRMFGNHPDTGVEQRERSIASRKRMGKLLTSEYENLISTLHP